LDLLIDSLTTMRRRVAERDHESLLELLQRAATARRAMSERAPRPEELVEVRIPVQDRPGAFAEIAVLATELGINIFDVEIAHSVEGDRGVLVVVIDAAGAPTFSEALAGKGHRSSTAPVGAIR
jgi:prephenate dehydrogenase